MTYPPERNESNNAPVHGFINLYKTEGPTSMEVVRQIKRLTRQRKRVGHGGTLDPLAEGVLPICFGQATRLMEFLVESQRQYRIEVYLGITTSTYDGEGEVVKRTDPSGVGLEAVEEALKSFDGIIYQTPPMFSAIKVGGKRLYKLARAGVEVERAPRRVEIRQIRLLDFASPSIFLVVDSGRGAYMRSLAHDLGEALGCGAYLKSLVRLGAGCFKVEDAVPLSRLQAASRPDSWREYLRSVDSVLLHMKNVAVSKAAERYIRSGQSVSLPPHVGAYADYMEKLRVYTQDGRFLAVVDFDKPRNQWRPYKVFDLDTPSPHAPVLGNN